MAQETQNTVIELLKSTLRMLTLRHSCSLDNYCSLYTKIHFIFRMNILVQNKPYLEVIPRVPEVLFGRHLNPVSCYPGWFSLKVRTALNFNSTNKVKIDQVDL